MRKWFDGQKAPGTVASLRGRVNQLI